MWKLMAIPNAAAMLVLAIPLTVFADDVRVGVPRGGVPRAGVARGASPRQDTAAVAEGTKSSDRAAAVPAHGAEPAQLATGDMPTSHMEVVRAGVRISPQTLKNIAEAAGKLIDWAVRIEAVHQGYCFVMKCEEKPPAPPVPSQSASPTPSSSPAPSGSRREAWNKCADGAAERAGCAPGDAKCRERAAKEAG